jgi:hypothetical protein
LINETQFTTINLQICILPVEDGDQIMMQRYEPNCKRNVKKVTNHLKFEITDENGKLLTLEERQL